MKLWKRLIPLTLAMTLLAGCAQGAAGSNGSESLGLDEIYVDQVALGEVLIEDEAVALAGAPAVNNMLLPVASGKAVKENTRVTIDYSNTQDGYVMVNFTGTTKTRLKVQVIGPATTYTYNLNVGCPTETATTPSPCWRTPLAANTPRCWPPSSRCPWPTSSPPSCGPTSM